MYDDTLHQADDDECFTQIIGTNILGKPENLQAFQMGFVVVTFLVEACPTQGGSAGGMLWPEFAAERKLAVSWMFRFVSEHLPHWNLQTFQIFLLTSDIGWHPKLHIHSLHFSTRWCWKSSSFYGGYSGICCDSCLIFWTRIKLLLFDPDLIRSVCFFVGKMVNMRLFGTYHAKVFG